MRTKSTLWRRMSSWRTRPASMVFPSPTSSAMKRFARGGSGAFRSGGDWWGRSLVGGLVDLGDVSEPMGLGTLDSGAELELPEDLELPALVVVVETDELY